MSVAVDQLADQKGPAIAQLGREAPELMAGVRLGQRCSTFRCFATREEGGTSFARERVRVQTQLRGKRPIQLHELGLRDPLALPRNVEPLEFGRVAVVEREDGVAGHRLGPG